jgi:cytoskeletal protein CcmA (bactofilin family)
MLPAHFSRSLNTMALFSKDPAPAAKPDVRVGSAVPAGGTFFGANITIEGTVTGTEPVVIEGTIHGKIDLQSDLRIGTKARIEATVHARNVTVEGRLNGDISADERVELVASATVDGNIKAPKIVVAEGARFRGNVDMGSRVPKEDANGGAAKAK